MACLPDMSTLRPLEHISDKTLAELLVTLFLCNMLCSIAISEKISLPSLRFHNVQALNIGADAAPYQKFCTLETSFTGQKVPCPLVGNEYKMAMKCVILVTFHT